MPPFRFNIPFFSYGSPSRLSSGTTSPTPSPVPPTPPSRPPFRPAGIAQPSKPATSLDSKSKVPPSLSRVKSNVAAIAGSSSSGSPSKRLESSKAEEKKVAMKEKPSREIEKEAGENINQVIEKPPIASSGRKEAEEAQEPRKKTEVEKLAVEERNSKTAQERQKRKETEKLAVEEKKRVLRKDMEENSKTAQERQKRNETEKLAVEEKKKVLRKDMEEDARKAQNPKETEKLPVEEKKKVQRKDMEENPKTGQEQQNPKETEKLAVEEKKKVLRKDMEEDARKPQNPKETEKFPVEEKKKVQLKDMEENSRTGQEQQNRKETEKRASQERNKALQMVGREDATRSKTTRNIAAASESTRAPIDPPERKMQNRREIHTGDNRRNTNGEGSSSMSKGIKEDIRDGLSKLTWGKSNGDEKSVSVYTLTGENRGATMSVNSEKDKKDDEVHIRRGYRSNPDESPNTRATETEGERSLYNGKNPKDEEEEARVKAYVNGNSQAINNSIVCESSVRENDPGIHMSFRFEKTKNETINPPENVAEKKSETVTATEKLRNHEPRVRRRCLRGLLAESSDSEPANPLKPPRHGCRFTCKDKDIENT